MLQKIRTLRESKQKQTLWTRPGVKVAELLAPLLSINPLVPNPRAKVVDPLAANHKTQVIPDIYRYV